MDNFKKACVLTNEEWISTLPNTIDDYVLSENCNEKLSLLLCEKKNNKSNIFSKYTLRYILIAAIIAVLLLATTAIAIPSVRKFAVENFDVDSLYIVESSNKRIKNADLICSYVPNGFVIDKTHYGIDGKISAYEYLSSNGDFYIVDKTTDNAVVYFDTEEYPSEEFEIDGIAYVYYKSRDGFNGIIWNAGGYIYDVSGKVSKEELINIAKYTK